MFSFNKNLRITTGKYGRGGAAWNATALLETAVGASDMRFGHSRNYLHEGQSDPVLRRSFLNISMQLLSRLKLNTSVERQRSLGFQNEKFWQVEADSS